MRLSPKMHAVLRDLADHGGSRKFMSGWPTYDALKARGLVKITGDPDTRLGWIVKLTEEGWAIYPTGVIT